MISGFGFGFLWKGNMEGEVAFLKGEKKKRKEKTKRKRMKNKRRILLLKRGDGLLFDEVQIEFEVIGRKSLLCQPIR